MSSKNTGSTGSSNWLITGSESYEDTLKTVVSIAELARTHSLPLATVKYAAQHGNLPAKKVGRDWIVDTRDERVRTWLYIHTHTNDLDGYNSAMSYLQCTLYNAWNLDILARDLREAANQDQHMIDPFEQSKWWDTLTTIADDITDLVNGYILPPISNTRFERTDTIHVTGYQIDLTRVAHADKMIDSSPFTKPTIIFRTDDTAYDMAALIRVRDVTGPYDVPLFYNVTGDTGEWHLDASYAQLLPVTMLLNK
jgi:hypothetical protein